MLIFSPRVTGENWVDVSSIRRMLADPRFADKEGEDLAIALWEFIVDPFQGLYHSCPALERLHGHFVYSVPKLLNSLGWSVCGVTANTLATLYRDAGMDSRVATLPGHHLTEVYYDGAWHLIDGDLQAYHRKHPPHEDTIASYQECIDDPTLVSNQQNPSEPYYIPDRPAERMAEMYRKQANIAPQAPFPDHSHTMDFVLRPGESLTRSAEMGRKWIWFDNYTDFKQRYADKEWKDDGPWERFEPHRRFGQGQWRYEPNLTDGFADFHAGVLQADNAAPGPEGVTPTAVGEASCEFDFDSPWVYTGTPAVDGEQTPRDGCVVTFRLSQKDDSIEPRLLLAVEPDTPWQTVWTSPGLGSHEVTLDLTEFVVNAYRYRLRFAFGPGGPGSAILEALKVHSSVMVAPPSLGRLVEGENALAVEFGDDHGELTRRWVVETNIKNKADLIAKADRLENLEFCGEPDFIRPVNSENPYEIHYRLDAPPHGTIRRVFAQCSVRGAEADAAGREQVEVHVAPSEDGPWQEVFAHPVEATGNRWHYSVEGEADLNEPTPSCVVRIRSRAGLNLTRLRASYTDDRTSPQPGPLHLLARWREADGETHEHREAVSPGNDAQPFVIQCGREPEVLSWTFESGSIPAK